MKYVFWNRYQYQDKIKIFGHKFVNKNKDKCIIIYKGEAFPLTEYFSMNYIDGKDYELGKIEIILVVFNCIIDKSYMFDGTSLNQIYCFKENKDLFYKSITIIKDNYLNFNNPQKKKNFI